MSHLPERKEKICLNCKSVIYGRYCHLCGQENTEPRESFWHLVTHFVYDITHFDGKFFSTLNYLLFRPGHLSKEYMRGRRVAYLNPIRMYVFTSAFFFIIYFSLVATSAEEKAGKAEKELIASRNALAKKLQAEKDTAAIRKMRADIADADSAIQLIRETGLVPVATNGNAKITGGSKSRVINIGKMPNTLHEYDSMQQALPPEKRNSWLKRQLVRKSIAINMKYQGRSKEFIGQFSEKFRHSIPQMMFISLPLVALILQLLYVRRKQFYYVNHVIFTIHEYIGIFILLLVFYALGGLAGWTGWSVFTWLRVILLLSILYYVYKSMRNYYGQGRFKTILKFLLLNVTVMIIFVLLSAVFIVNSLLHM